MKSPFALPAGLALLLALSACGQTGPLYMPKPPKPGAPQSAPAPAAAQPMQVLSPPAPAAGVTMPAANSNSNNTASPNQPLPATQQ